MATNWLIITGRDIVKVIAIEVFSKSNENVDQDSIDAQLAENTLRQYDPDVSNRADEQVIFAVNQFRAAIQLSNKSPLSVTAGALPPEAVKHALYMAAFGLVNSTPNLQMVVLTDKGAVSPLADNFKKADAYLQKLCKSGQCVPPSDPTGRDYLTAINIPWYGKPPSPYPAYDNTKPLNPPISAVRFGATSRPADLTTFGSIYNHIATNCEFPVDGLGQP